MGCIEALIVFIGPELASSYSNVVLPVAVTALRNLSTHPMNHGTIAKRAAGILWRISTPNKVDSTVESEAAIVVADAAAAVVNLLQSRDPMVRTYLYRIQVTTAGLTHKPTLIV